MRARKQKVNLQMRQVDATYTYSEDGYRMDVVLRSTGKPISAVWHTFHRNPCAFGKRWDDETWYASRSVITKRIRVSWLAVLNGAGISYWPKARKPPKRMTKRKVARPKCLTFPGGMG